MTDFSGYLRSISAAYEKWWQCYALTDLETDRVPSSPFGFELMVETVTRPGRDGEEKRDRFPVLQGLYDYVARETHVLLVGRPGSGKSTALVRVLVEEAQRIRGSIQEVPVLVESRSWKTSVLMLIQGFFQTQEQNLNLTAEDPVGRIPVLVELRSWKTSVLDLIRAFFQTHGLTLTIEQVRKLLADDRLLLLVDGLNELPSEAAQQDVTTLRDCYHQVPMIFTTRDLSLGGDFGIQRQLHMQPLTEPQMQTLIRAYVRLEQVDAMWRQITEGLRKFAETPLLLWMLCELFKVGETIPKNLGEVFRQFTQAYEQSSVLKGNVCPLSDRRLWSTALKHLAAVMMRGEKPVDLRTVISRDEATRELMVLFGASIELAVNCVADLEKYHLLQVRSGNDLEFHHQLFQEYYAAEWLLDRLGTLTDGELQQDYLNYLKWTEPVAMMLALADKEQAMRVVRLALEVDLMLGARLAGEVKPQFQAQTVGLVDTLEVPEWLNLKLCKLARSAAPIPGLLRALQSEDSEVSGNAARTLRDLGSEAAIPGLVKLLQGEKDDVFWKAASLLVELKAVAAIPELLKLLQGEKDDVFWKAIDALVELKAVAAIPELLKLLQGEKDDVFWKAVGALVKLKAVAAIPELLKLLQDEDMTVRWKATDVLSKLGSKVAIPGLLIALQHEDRYIRRWANFDKLGSDAIPELLKLLQHENEYVRARAASALGKLRASIAIPGLLTALKCDTDYVCWTAAEALGKLEATTAIPELLIALQRDDERVRFHAAEALGKLRAEAVIPGLLKVLQHRNSLVRKSVVRALGNLDCEAAIPGLLTALRDTDSDVRSSAANELGELGSESTTPSLLTALQNDAIPSLLIALQDERSLAYKSIVKALEMIGSEAAIPKLLQLLQHDDCSVRVRAAETLGKLGSEAAIPGLLTALQDEKWTVFCTVVEALGNLGSEAVVPGLLSVLQEDDEWARSYAAKALGNLGSRTVIPSLIERLQDDNESVRASVAEALVKLESEDKHPWSSIIRQQVRRYRLDNNDRSLYITRTQYILCILASKTNVTELLIPLQSEDSEIRKAAAAALEKLASEAVIPDLLIALRHKDSNVRQSVASALGKLGSKTAIPGLLVALKDEDSNVRRSAADVLSDLGSEEAIPGLLVALKDEDSNVQRAALRALGHCGWEEAIPGLLVALKDEDSNVRRSALWALRDLECEATIPGLLIALKDENSNVRESALYGLCSFKDDHAVHILPNILVLIPTNSGEVAFYVLTFMQEQCKFYNYEIYQQAQAVREKRDQETGDRPPTTYHFPNATEVRIFEQVDTYHQNP